MGLSCLRDYHCKVLEAAVENGFGVINGGLHYRASRDWRELTGLSREALADINTRGIEFYGHFARGYASPDTPMLVGGVIGPRGDAYNTDRMPDAAEAEDYHSEQILAFRDAGADQVTRRPKLSTVERNRRRAAWRDSSGERKCGFRIYRHLSPPSGKVCRHI